MDSVRRAVIDVGTNSVKLLVADVAGDDVQPVWEESKQTRLGRGFYDTHRLQPAAVAATAKAVGDFASAARERGAASIRIIATSAAREAVNARELTVALETAAGLKVEIISGEQEADLVFQGVTTDPQLAQGPLLLLEVGGGSTEFIVGQGRAQVVLAERPAGHGAAAGETSRTATRPSRMNWRLAGIGCESFLEREVRPSLEAACRARSGEWEGDGRRKPVRAS